MSQLGTGEMYAIYQDGDIHSGAFRAEKEASAKTFQENMGKVITALDIDEERLLFTFADGNKMKLFDDGQDCCEQRYMHTDDNIQDFVGAILQGAEVRDGPEEISEWEEPIESAFLIISTSIGQFTVVNYNEHNGHYGGFCICATAV